jgi:hypothetical protein
MKILLLGRWVKQAAWQAKLVGLDPVGIVSINY